ncbi:hypothetical protein GCM10010392_25590 [Streptomyces clavifer]|nr:hypothetical protein GCM10010392_25590 [Streptomyces clavifer]
MLWAVVARFVPVVRRPISGGSAGSAGNHPPLERFESMCAIIACECERVHKRAPFSPVINGIEGGEQRL